MQNVPLNIFLELWNLHDFRDILKLLERVNSKNSSPNVNSNLGGRADPKEVQHRMPFSTLISCLWQETE